MHAAHKEKKEEETERETNENEERLLTLQNGKI